MKEDNTFEIKILRQHWIKDDGLNDVNDLCSHGEIYIRIGNEVLSDSEKSSWTTSAMGLHLMRTLTSDYAPGDFGAQLIPCCGHFMCFNETGTHVEIIGCPSGIDWQVNHTNDYVELTTQEGNVVKITSVYYKDVILNFIQEVEAFYGDPNEKIIPDDDLERDTFIAFWKEWNNLKNQG